MPRKLLERVAELKALHRVVADARSERGGVVLVEGPSGIGKSVLLDAACESARSLGVSVLRGVGRDLESGLAFGVALQWFEPIVSRAGDARTHLLAGPAANTAVLFDRTAIPKGYEYVLHHGLYWLTVNLAETRPLVLVLDDAQWSDPQSLRFLLYLSQRIVNLPVGVLVASHSRPPGPTGGLLDRLAASDRTTSVRPAPLTPSGVAQLLESYGGPPDNAFCQECARLTGGNPFFVRELVRAVPRGMDPAAWLRANVAYVPVPERVIRSVNLRLNRLSVAARQLARAAAVMQRSMAVADLARVAQLEDAAAQTAVTELADADILGSGEPLDILHPLVGAAIRENLSAQDMNAVHARAASALAKRGASAESVASHILSSSCPLDAWAVEVLRVAAKDAAAKGAPSSAIGYLKRALRESPPAHARLAVLVEVAEAEAALGEVSAICHFQEAIGLASDPAQLPPLLLHLGRALAAAGRFPESADAFDRGLRLVKADSRELELQLQAGWVSVARRVPGLREHTGERIIAVIAALDAAPSHSQRVLLGEIGRQLVLAGEPRGRARAWLKRSLADGQLIREESADGLHWIGALGALGVTDDLEGYEAGVQLAFDNAQQRGSIRGFMNASYVRAWSAYAGGRLAAAADDLREVIEAAALGITTFWAAAVAQLVLVLIEQDDLDEASKVMKRYETEAGQWTATSTHAVVLQARGELRQRQGERAPALADFLHAGRIALEAGASNPAVIPWRSGAALAAATLGDQPQACALAEEELELAREFGAPRAVGRALRTLGLIHRGSRGLGYLDQAVEMLQPTRAKLDYTQTLVDFAAALRRVGKRAIAREHLRHGLDLAHGMGAMRIARYARAELTAAGARPRRLALAGAASLTPSELRVAQMAAAGKTNRQIAQALFVTPKAIQWHLSNTYRKLSVPGREQLHDALGDLAAELRPSENEPRAP